MASQTVPASPEALTIEFLRSIIASRYPHRVMQSFTWKDLDVGVISKVVSIQLTLKDSTTGQTQDNQVVAKFLRPEFPFERMFQVESKFYHDFGLTGQESNERQKEVSKKLPFAIPTPVFTSNMLIVMDRVPAVSTFTCLDGCPSNRIKGIVMKLAQMHARFWNHDGAGLASPAGIGSDLSGEAKVLQFPKCWAAVLDDIPLQSTEKSRLSTLCEILSAKPGQLETIHNLVADGPSTLIHGDFHVANMLFPNDVSDDNVWLLDWATCGKGNPMRDLAFFFIVGVTDQDRQAQEQECLSIYHETMIKEGRSTLTLEHWKHHYRLCVLNQFLILVVYDKLSKQLASNARTEKLRHELHAHFQEVNRRACLSVLDNFHDDNPFGLLE